MSEKTTREELDFFIDNPLLGIVYLDKQYRIIRCNMKFEEMFGYKLEEIKSKNLDEIIDGDQDMTMISQNGESIHGSGKRNKKDGTIIEVEIYGIPKISGKTRIGTLGIYLDITERKLAEETIVKSQHELEERVKERTAELIRVNEQLQEEIVVREQTQKKLIDSEDKYRTYVEHANDGISVVHKGEITFVNSRLAEIIGFKVDELVGKDFLQFIPKSKLNQITDNLKRRLAGEEVPQVYESRILHKDGSEIDVEFNITTIEANDEPATLAIIRDITERKRAEEALRESETILSMAGRTARFGGWSAHPDEQEVVWSEQVALIHEKQPGYSPTVEEAIQHYAPEWRDKIAEVLQKCTHEGTPYDEEMEIITAGGHRLWVRTTGEAVRDNLGEIVRVQGSFQDITKRKQAEEALRESEGKYKAIFNDAQVALFRTGISDGKLVEINERYANMAGYSNIEDCMAEFNAADAWADPNARNELLKILKEKGSVNDYETEIIRRDGSPLWIIFSATIFPEQGFVEGSIVDINEHKQAEEALRESEQENKLILSNMSDYVWIFDLSTFRITYASPVAEKILGYSPDEMKTLDLDAFFSPETMETVTGVIERELSIDGQDGVDPDRQIVIEPKLLHKDRSEVWTEVSFSLLRDTEGKPTSLIGTTRDITERKQRETQFQQAQKMEAISTLAGGIAHEFNNALMGIMGNIELLKIDLPEDERRDRFFEAMTGSGHRMSRLTDQLLAYAKGGKYQPKNLKLDNFVIETLPIMQHDLNSATRVETHIPKDISFVNADNAQMQMLLSAILSNSNEAIEDEGIIRITAENKDVDDDLAKQLPGLRPGPYVCLTVEDDGKGMDEQTRSGIFEPFFTTKFQGRGMGMAAVYGIVKNHNGQIYVDSELGKGTTVRIYLPAIEIEIEKPKEAEAEIPAGSGTILMIEDEDMVIDVTRTMLEMLGYRVMVAKTGKDAIHIAETLDGQIDLALLDIKLPDISGTNLYPLIMKARSNLKVIVWSGYSIDGPAREILDAGAQDFLHKPFTFATLSEKLKEVLEGE